MYQQGLKEYIVKKLDGKKINSVLELGCRSAEWLNFFSESVIEGNAVLRGIDISSKMFDMVPYDSNKIFLEVADVNNLQFSTNEKYDLIFVKDLFEFVKERKRLIKKLHNLLAPNGQVVIVNCDYKSTVFSCYNSYLAEKAICDFSYNRVNGECDDAAIIGRKIFGIFKSSGLFDGEVSIYNELETNYTEYSSGKLLVDMICDMYEERHEEEIALTFKTEIENSVKKGLYMFDRVYYVYTGTPINAEKGEEYCD